MNKREFEEELLQRLKTLPKDEKQKILDYYDEIFFDRKEQGEAEEEIIKSFGDVKEIASKHFNEEEAFDTKANQSIYAKVANKTKKTVARFFTNKSFLIFYFSAFIITIPLTIAFLSIILSICIVAASLIISFFVIAASFLIAGPAYVIYGTAFVGLGKSSGLALTGCGLAIFALGIGFVLLLKFLNIVRIALFVSSKNKSQSYTRAHGKGIFKGFMRPAIAISIIIVLGGSVFTTGLAKAGWNVSRLDTATYISVGKTFTDPIDKISINVKTRDINIFAASGNNSSIEASNYDGSTVSVTLQDGKLEISETYKFQIKEAFNIFGSVNENLRRINVYVPASIDQITADITSGSVKITGLIIKDITINITSGNTSIKESTVTNATMKSTSGNISTSDCTITNFIAKVTSGNINTYSLHATTVDLRATSGNIHAKIIGLHQDYDISSSVTSGINRVGNYRREGDNRIYIQATSGNIKLTFVQN